MRESGADCADWGGESSIDGDWKVTGIYVHSDINAAEGHRLRNVNELTAYFGQPDYYGVANVNLAEAVAANLLAERDSMLLGQVRMRTKSSIDDIYEVTDYDDDFQIYLYSYIVDGLNYTFYTTGSGQSSFVMYSIELC